MNQTTRRANNSVEFTSKRAGEARGALTGALLLAGLLSASGACLQPPDELRPGGAAAGGRSPDPVGGPGPAGAPSPGEGCGIEQARAYFDANVAPLIDDGAGKVCASCHSSGYDDDPTSVDFLGDSPATYYDRLVADPRHVGASPSTSLFLTWGQHSGPAWDPETQAPVIEAWLDMEAEARFTGCDAPPGAEAPTGPTFDELAVKFMACMTLEDWVDTGMHLIGAQQTLVDGPCHKCHEGGGPGNNPMSDPGSPADPNTARIEDGFKQIQTVSRIKNLIRPIMNETTGQIEGLEQSHRWRDKGDDLIPPHKYILPENHVAAMEEWFSRTMQCFDP